MSTLPAGSGTVRDFVGYGQHLPKVTWPNGANVAVNLVVNYEEGSEYSFDRDGQNDVPVEAPYNFPLDTRDLSRESMYEYGSRAGIWRLMRLFDELEVPCTFYACAEAFEKNPEVARYARAAGYDLLSHGNRWVEQWRFTREEEREQMALAIKSFEGTWGSGPVRGTAGTALRSTPGSWWSKRVALSMTPTPTTTTCRTTSWWAITSSW